MKQLKYTRGEAIPLASANGDCGLFKASQEGGRPPRSAKARCATLGNPRCPVYVHIGAVVGRRPS